MRTLIAYINRRHGLLVLKSDEDLPEKTWEAMAFVSQRGLDFGLEKKG